MATAKVDDLGGADPYDVLGIERDADDDAIVEAHRRLMRVAHPDLPTGDAVRARLLNLARDVLLDPAARGELDRSRQPEPPVAEPPHQDRASVWDDVDGLVLSPIVTTTAPPPQPPWQPPRQPPRQPPLRVAPVRPPSGRARPVPPSPASPSSPPSGRRRPRVSLGLAALLLCWLYPVSMVLALTALARRGQSRASRALAVVAICLATFVGWPLGLSLLKLAF